MKPSIFIAILVTFLSQLSLASKLSCSKIFYTMIRFDNIYVSIEQKKYPEPILIKNYIEEIHEYIGDLKQPKLNFIYISNDNSAFFDRIYNKIVLGTQIEGDFKALRFSKDKMDPIFAHEYGHAVYTQNRYQESQKVRALTHQVSYYEFIFIELNEMLSTTIDPFSAEYTAKKERQKLLQEQLLQKNKDAKKIDTLSWGLYEFFADVVSVVLSKDPRIIEKGIKNSTSPVDIDYSRLRNFLDNKDNYNLWKSTKTYEGISKTITMFTLAHHIFYPARIELWNLIKSHIKSPNYAKTVIPRLYRVLSEYEEILLTRDLSKFEFTIEEIKKLNDELILRLNAEF